MDDNLLKITFAVTGKKDMAAAAHAVVRLLAMAFEMDYHLGGDGLRFVQTERDGDRVTVTMKANRADGCEERFDQIMLAINHHLDELKRTEASD